MWTILATPKTVLRLRVLIHTITHVSRMRLRPAKNLGVCSNPLGNVQKPGNLGELGAMYLRILGASQNLLGNLRTPGIPRQAITQSNVLICLFPSRTMETWTSSQNCQLRIGARFVGRSRLSNRSMNAAMENFVKDAGDTIEVPSSKH